MPDTNDFSWLRLVFAFSVVALLLAGMGFVLKYVATRGLLLPMGKTKTRRLKIVETLAIDTKRRMVIVRCDEHEHLLLLNGERDIVVDTNLPASSLAPEKT